MPVTFDELVSNNAKHKREFWASKGGSKNIKGVLPDEA